ncbi:gliding motility lipoprotein GldJ [Prolixibacteraceae bacterium JC049]|nr:gliding motility lipoprotein GldJ [Prolixibacteraceae bacterium JC049]
MNIRSFLTLAFAVAVLSSCNKKGSSDVSSSTGWDYNDTHSSGAVADDYEQATGPGLVYIEGGTFTMGRVQEDVMFRWDNYPRRVTVASFYMDETEVKNIDYREFLDWTAKVYAGDRAKYEEVLPDTLVWREELAYNEPYINNYLRHPAYSNYPVVGVSWEQANQYCKWRTDRVNEGILIERGILQRDPDQKGENVFTTETYLAGLYTGKAGEQRSRRDSVPRKVRWEDGVLLPNYRLPTEAEWEYSALGLVGNAEGELLTERKMYPWNGTYLREADKKNRGRMKANFTRGKGDMMGMAGALNDNADITAPVNSYDPNDYGLYCMAGNVNEWVADVYRPQSHLDTDEFQPFRGNVFTKYRRDENGQLLRDKYGKLVKDTIADYRNYKDGSYDSQIIEGARWNNEKGRVGTNNMYVQGSDFSSLITDKVRVYKGGSWKDRPYWLIPGTRRYLDQRKSASDIGFRCAMTRVGSPKGF